MPRLPDSLKLNRIWARLGDRTDPEDANLTPPLNWEQGWDASFEGVGGNPVRRDVVNAVLSYVIGMLVEINQHSGLLEWDDEIDYVHPARALGSDGREYASVQDSTDQNPVLDSGNTYWVPVIGTTTGRISAVLTNALAELNQHGLLRWNTNKSYQHPSVVLGSDNNIYVTARSNIGQNPVNDTGDDWIQLTREGIILPASNNDSQRGYIVRRRTGGDGYELASVADVVDVGSAAEVRAKSPAGKVVTAGNQQLPASDNDGHRGYIVRRRTGGDGYEVVGLLDNSLMLRRIFIGTSSTPPASWQEGDLYFQRES